MKRTLAVFFTVAAAPLAFAAGDWKVPVLAAEEFGRPGAFDARSVTDRDGGAFLASSCADLARGFSLPQQTNLDIRESSVVAANCQALRIQLSAKDPKTASFEGYALTAKALDELPPCFEPLVSPDEKAADAGTRSLRESSKTARATADGAALVIADTGYTARLRLAGRGDVNADGLDDLILRSDWGLSGGSLGGSSTLVLTKKPGEKVMRVLSDSGGRCLASSSIPPPAVCGEETGKRMRAEFQVRYDKKDYVSAYQFLDGFLQACTSDLPPLSASWIRNDLALTAHQLGRDARCLEIAGDAGLQDVSNDAEAKLQKAVEANAALCEKSLRCTAKQVTAARSAFKKSFDKGDVAVARAALDAFVKGCDGSIEGSAHAWALSDLAFAANKAGDKAVCSAYLDIAERIQISEYEEQIPGALAANRKNCPRPEPVPVSTPVTAAAASGSVRECDVRAFVLDPDPKGLNVRTAPNGKSKVEGVLPTGAEIRISGSDRGWLRLSHAEYAAVEGENATTEGLPQSGWVFKKLTGTATRNYGSESVYFLHEKPDKASKVVSDPRQSRVPILDCNGEWVQVEFEGKVGWLEPEGQCSNQVTNCS